MVKALEKSCGNMSYKDIENHIGGTVTENIFAKHLKTIKGFTVS